MPDLLTSFIILLNIVNYYEIVCGKSFPQYIQSPINWCNNDPLNNVSWKGFKEKFDQRATASVNYSMSGSLCWIYNTTLNSIPFFGGTQNYDFSLKGTNWKIHLRTLKIWEDWWDKNGECREEGREGGEKEEGEWATYFFCCLCKNILTLKM